MKPKITHLILVFLAHFGLIVECKADIVLSEKLTSVLKENCINCHNAEKKKGKFDLEHLLKNPNSPERWMDIFHEVSEGNMPPEDEPQLSGVDQENILNHLPAFKAGKTTRLLTPAEINNTLIDFFKADEQAFNAETLLAVNYDDESFFTQQDEVISPYYLDDLYKTLDTSINTLVHARKLPEPVSVSAMITQTGHVARTFNVKTDKSKKTQIGDLRWRWKNFSSGFSFQYPGEDEPNTLPPGSYEIELDLESPNMNQAFKSPDLARPFGFLKTKKNFELAFFLKGGRTLGQSKLFTVVDAPIERKKISLRVDLTRPSKLSVALVKGPTGGSFKYAVDKVYGKKGIWKSDLAYPLPCVRFHGIKIHGPVSLVKTDTTIFGDKLSADEVRKRLSLIQKKNYLPVDEDHFKSFQYFRSEGFSFEEAYRKSILMFFMSSSFLNLNDSDDFRKKLRFASYSLLKSPPTQEFKEKFQQFQKDRNGKAFADWLVHSPRFKRFVNPFTGQWLKFGHLASNPPGKTMFPAFYQQKMGDTFPAETLAFVTHLFSDNRPIDELVTADYSFLNPSLHNFYQTGDESGEVLASKTIYESLGEYKKHKFDDPNRGGILTQGAFLTVNSNGVEELPIRRAVWILENILNKKVPEPSSSVDIEQFEMAKSVSFGDRIKLHTRNQNCSSCHQRIDPLAVVMNSFDTIGHLKETPGEKSSRSETKTERKARKVENQNKSGKKSKSPIYVIPTREDYTVEFDGAKLSSVSDLKRYLKTKDEAIAGSFVRNLLKFTLGREPVIDDNEKIQKIISSNRSGSLGTRDLLASFLEAYF